MSNFEEKWGAKPKDGFVQIPIWLLKHQKALGLSDGEMVALLHIISRYWNKGQELYLSAKYVAGYIGVSERTVQRNLTALCEKGVIKKIGVRKNENPDIRGQKIFSLAPLLRIINAEAT